MMIYSTNVEYIDIGSILDLKYDIHNQLVQITKVYGRDYDYHGHSIRCEVKNIKTNNTKTVRLFDEYVNSEYGEIMVNYGQYSVEDFISLFPEIFLKYL